MPGSRPADLPEAIALVPHRRGEVWAWKALFDEDERFPVGSSRAGSQTVP
jgi:hypothetical protein